MKAYALAMLVAAAVVPWAGRAAASDEVDYSAPYLTLEDGKLVTRYPAKPHEPSAALQAEAAGTRSEPRPADERQGQGPARSAEDRALFATVAAAVVAALVLAAGAAILARRRARAPSGSK